MTSRLLIRTAFVFILMIFSSSSVFALSDISGHRNANAIEFLNQRGVISGYSDGTFQPNKTVNRAELLKILVGGKGVSPSIEEYSNCFPDVTEEWFAPFVCYAKKEGWVGGYPDGSFQPSKVVNKVEAIKMLVNSQGLSISSDVKISLFDDVDNSQWYAPYLKAAKEKGLLEETQGNFGITAEMTRAGLSENIYRAMIIKENSLMNFSEFQQNKVSDTSTKVDVGSGTIKTHYRLWTVNDVQVLDSSNDYLLLNPGNKFVAVHLTNQNVSGETRTFDNVVLLLKDDSGNEYEISYMKTMEPELKGGILEDGEKRSGWITFEVPLELLKADVVFISTSDTGETTRLKKGVQIPERQETSKVEEDIEEEETVNPANLSISAFWKSWDADAEDDGFELSSFFKNEDGEPVYPKVKDWSVNVKIYIAETDYNKYGDFDTHKLPSMLHEIHFSKEEVKYSGISLPFVRIPEEKVSKLTEELEYVWIDATFESETYGTFSDSDSFISFHKNS